MIGLEIDLKKIVRAGRVILFAAGGQLIGAVFALGIVSFVAIGLSMGGGRFDAVYLTSPVRFEHGDHRQGAV